jgi:hypothetical protein
MVPAQFHFEERRAGKLRQSFSPDLARPLDPLLGVFNEVVVMSIESALETPLRADQPGSRS